MKKLLVIALLLNALLLAGRFWQELPASAQAGPVAIANGDINGDGLRDVSDGVAYLNWLFLGGAPPVAVAQEGGLTPEQAEILGHLSLVQTPLRVGGAETVKTLRVTGVNLQIVNGADATETTNGVGNLVVGYQESVFGDEDRSGSHNIVAGQGHSHPSYGGFVMGRGSSILGAYASVSGGSNNRAEGNFSSVSGGDCNAATGDLSSINGGNINTASGQGSTVSGGEDNNARGDSASVCGGVDNLAEGSLATVSGGASNTARGESATVSGGEENTADDDAVHVP